MSCHRPSLRARLVVLLVAAVGLGVARGGTPDLSPFIGDWAIESSGTISLTCANLPITASAPYAFSVSAGTASDLEFHLSCHCNLPLAIVEQQARLVAPTVCRFVIDSIQVKATVTDLTLDLSSSPPTLAVTGVDAQGRAFTSGTPGTVDCSALTMAGALHKTTVTPTLCGPDETAVGILPYSPEGTMGCWLGWVGQEAVDIQLSTNGDASCPSGTGDHGEGKWVLPQAEHHLGSCVPAARPNPAAQVVVGLPFCRVDGRSFKPLTTDPTATDQSYAVLMLGSECPNGSKRAELQIDTPETGDRSSCAGGAPDQPCGPNQGVNVSGIATTFSLNFCVFASADRPEETMSSFPDLVEPYAVFHDFDGLQPSWVMLKRWVYALEGPGNRLLEASGAEGNLASIVESTADDGLYFEMARVH
jgi:hypothetical protein